MHYIECRTCLQTVAKIKFSDYKDQILALRKKVWEQTDPSLMKQLFVNGFYDEHDETAFHWGVFDDEKLIASARLSKHYLIETLPDFHLLEDIKKPDINFPIASLNRLVIDKEFQGNGLSTAFDKVRIAKAKLINCQSICGMTYGKRGNKLLSEGFNVYHSLKLSKGFVSDKESAKNIPPAFYYKELK